MTTALPELKKAVITGDMPAATRLTQRAIGEGCSPPTIFEEGLIQAMDVVGQKMKSGEFYIPEVLIAARAMKAASAILEPLMAVRGDSWPVRGRVVIGTVKGDLHDIGKNLVIMMFKGAGFETIDLGVDVPTEKFVASVQETRPDILGLSALLTTTMMAMKEVLEALREAGCREPVRVLVGGAPVTQDFADEIGADGYGPDAATGVEIARSWIAWDML